MSPTRSFKDLGSLDFGLDGARTRTSTLCRQRPVWFVPAQYEELSPRTSGTRRLLRSRSGCRGLQTTRQKQGQHRRGRPRKAAEHARRSCSRFDAEDVRPSTRQHAARG